MRMLNLGCGATFHEDWVNVDYTDHGGKVLAYDLRLGIPFADKTFDVVYHSHILEHMPKAWGDFFLQECYRVLRPGGLLRVVLPDLENVTRAYLESLEAAKGGEKGAVERHQWMIVELIDQLTRSQSGGEMLNWWKQNPVPQEEFILERLGKEAELGMASAEGQISASPNTALPPVDTAFLLRGEAHKWMYDTVSLKELLHQKGFENIQQVAHNESALPKITQYGLDTQEDGRARKPDSFFMEAKKAEAPEEKPVRVTLFSTTDDGGAAIATLRFHEALQGIGVQSHIYVGQQRFFKKGVHIIPSSPVPQEGGVVVDGHKAEMAVRKELLSYRQKLHQAMARHPERPHGAEYFSIPGQCVPLAHVPFLEDTDIFHFQWVAGLLDPSYCFEYLRGKKIVWTLHDMNAFTGGCHYSNGCRKFEKMCCACPELGSTQEKDLAFETWRARMGTYRQLDLHIVAPSTWLAEEAQKSALLKRFPIHTIANAHPLNVYKPLDRKFIREQLGLKSNSFVLLFASQSLTNIRKGGKYLVDLLQALAHTPLKDIIHVFMLGNGVASEFLQAGIKVECLGHVDDDTYMAALYNAADVLISPSLEDNLPNVICEAMACGTPVVAFANGGVSEMILQEETGFLAESQNVERLLQGVLWAYAQSTKPLIRKLCRAHALRKWSSEKVALKYNRLYKDILEA